MPDFFGLKIRAGKSAAVRSDGRDMSFEKIVGRVPIELSLELVSPERDGH